MRTSVRTALLCEQKRGDHRLRKLGMLCSSILHVLLVTAICHRVTAALAHTFQPLRVGHPSVGLRADAVGARGRALYTSVWSEHPAEKQVPPHIEGGARATSTDAFDESPSVEDTGVPTVRLVCTGGRKGLARVATAELHEECCRLRPAFSDGGRSLNAMRARNCPGVGCARQASLDASFPCCSGSVMKDQSPRCALTSRATDRGSLTVKCTGTRDSGVMWDFGRVYAHEVVAVVDACSAAVACSMIRVQSPGGDAGMPCCLTLSQSGKDTPWSARMYACGIHRDDLLPVDMTRVQLRNVCASGKVLMLLQEHFSSPRPL